METLYYDEIKPGYFVMNPQDLIRDKNGDPLHYSLKTGYAGRTIVILSLYDRDDMTFICPDVYPAPSFLWSGQHSIYQVRLRLINGTEMDTKRSNTGTESKYAEACCHILETFGYKHTTSPYNGKFHNGTWCADEYGTRRAVTIEVPVSHFKTCIRKAYPNDPLQPDIICLRESFAQFEKDGVSPYGCLILKICERSENKKRLTYYARYNLADCMREVLSKASLTLMGEDLTWTVLDHIRMILVDFILLRHKRKFEAQFDRIPKSGYQNTEKAVLLTIGLLIQLKLYYNFNLFEYDEQRRNHNPHYRTMPCTTC